mgnify:CR=1 FL=1
MSELSRDDSVDELIDSLDQVGSTTADRLQADGLETVADVAGATPDDLMTLDGVGECRAERIHAAAEDEVSADPLVDSREVVLEATLGEKLQITLAERDAWANAWNVIEAPDPVEWVSGDDDNWHTRRLRMSESASGTAKKAREFDLVLAGDEIRVEDPPVEYVSAQPDAPGWDVESVGAVGRVSTSSLVQLQADDDKEEAKPDGDDTWRQYQHRGETA